MKKYPFTAVITILIVSTSYSQLSLYVVGGLSPESHPNTTDLFVNSKQPRDEFIFTLATVKAQYFGGIKTSIPLSEYFFLESGLTYTKRTSVYAVDYTYRELHEPSAMDLTETENILMIPVNIGVKLGILDVTSGLTGNTSFSTKTDLGQINGYASDPATFRMGWSTGVRVNIANTAIGIEYQGSLNRVCEGSYVDNQPLEMRNVPGQFVFTIQYLIKG